MGGSWPLGKQSERSIFRFLTVTSSTPQAKAHPWSKAFEGALKWGQFHRTKGLPSLRRKRRARSAGRMLARTRGHSLRSNSGLIHWECGSWRPLSNFICGCLSLQSGVRDWTGDVANRSWDGLQKWVFGALRVHHPKFFHLPKGFRNKLG